MKFLAKQGYKIENYFHNYFYTYSHSNSIEAVAVRLADGASVDSYVWELHQKIDPFYVRETRIIYRSPEFPFTPIVIRKSIAPLIRDRIRNILLEMHKDEMGKRVLKKLFIDRFLILTDKDYDPIRKMLKFVDRYYK